MLSGCLSYILGPLQPVIVWRRTHHLALDRRGRLFASARWHACGPQILYCAPDPATAALEVLINGAVRDAEPSGGFHFLKIDVPDAIRMEHVEEGALPADWPRHSELAFHAPFGRRCIGADAIDVELVERPSELRIARAFDCARVIDSKDAVFVAVERQRLTVMHQLVARGLEVPER
jgi:hypothetical protein